MNNSCNIPVGHNYETRSPVVCNQAAVSTVFYPTYNTAYSVCEAHKNAIDNARLRYRFLQLSNHRKEKGSKVNESRPA